MINEAKTTMTFETNSGIFDLISVNTYGSGLDPAENFRLEEYEDTDEMREHFSTAAYGERIAKQLEDYYEKELLPVLKKLLISKIEVSEFRSPREYNFSGDTVKIKFTYNGRSTMSTLRNYLIRNRIKLAAYLKKNYSDCSGFHSFVEYKDVSRFISMVGTDERSTGIALQFYAENDDMTDVSQQQFEDRCAENIDFFDCLTDQGKEYSNKLYEEGELFYFIDLDERGEFKASLRNRDDNTLLEIDDSFFVDGFMKHKTDMVGLLAYVQSLGYITTKIIKSN